MSAIDIRVVVIRRDIALARQLAAANDRTSGRLCLSATPANDGLAPITRALLEAMDKRAGLTGGAACSTRYGWPLLPVWLRAHEIDEVIVAEAQLLPADALEQLIVLLVGLGIRLWLVAHRPVGASFPAVVGAWPVHEASRAELIARFGARRPTPVGGTATAARFPAVPGAEFMFFRAACRDLLSDEDFAVVDDRFRAAVGDARRWFDARIAGTATWSVHIASYLQGLLLDCAEPNEMLTVIRAVAAGLVNRGWRITADHTRFTSTVVNETWFLTRTTPDWDALAGYRQPYRAAVCALSHAGFTIAEMADLTVSGVSNDGRRVRHPIAGAVELGAGSEFLRAQALSRQAMGALDTDDLFVTADGRRVTNRYLREALTETALETPVDLARGRVSARRPGPEQWAERLGIRMQRWA